VKMSTEAIRQKKVPPRVCVYSERPAASREKAAARGAVVRQPRNRWGGCGVGSQCVVYGNESSLAGMEWGGVAPDPERRHLNVQPCRTVEGVIGSPSPTQMLKEMRRNNRRR